MKPHVHLCSLCFRFWRQLWLNNSACCACCSVSSSGEGPQSDTVAALTRLPCGHESFSISIHGVPANRRPDAAPSPPIRPKVLRSVHLLVCLRRKKNPAPSRPDFSCSAHAEDPTLFWKSVLYPRLEMMWHGPGLLPILSPAADKTLDLPLRGKCRSGITQSKGAAVNVETTESLSDVDTISNWWKSPSDRLKPESINMDPLSQCHHEEQADWNSYLTVSI